jgi:hypothetical protein
MRCDVLVISHLPDIPWLFYCVQLLEKNWKEPNSKIVIRLEEDDGSKEAVKDWKVKNAVYRYIKTMPDGYTGKMASTLISDDFSDADLLLLIDSDCMLLEPTVLSDIMEDGKPVIQYLEWSEQHPVAEKKWRWCTSKVLGIDVDREYMIAMPCLFWRETFNATRRQIVNTTGKGFFEAVYSDVPFKSSNFLEHPNTFADYEALGCYAAHCEPEKYVVQHRDIAAARCNWPFKLYWSHGGISQETREFLEEKLHGTPVKAQPLAL